jgi:hypothetical protein
MPIKQKQFHFPIAALHFQVKVKFALKQAMKAQRGSRGTALLFL